MKKIILILLFLSVAVLKVSAQTYGTKLDTNARYCLIMATKKLFSPNCTIEIDFGQQKRWFKNTTSLVDSLGNKIEFNSPIDALNFMNKNGWEFVDAYAITISNQNVYHYLMRKNE